MEGLHKYSKTNVGVLMCASEEIFDLSTEYANCLYSELVRSLHGSMSMHTCSPHRLVYNTQPCFSILATGASVQHIKKGKL